MRVTVIGMIYMRNLMPEIQRNRLVHGYNTLSDEVALGSIKILLPEIKKMRRFIETWI
jgi:uncharacterized protein YutE (UPF0331/DUF86 family)